MTSNVYPFNFDSSFLAFQDIIEGQYGERKKSIIFPIFHVTCICLSCHSFSFPLLLSQFFIFWGSFNFPVGITNRPSIRCLTRGSGRLEERDVDLNPRGLDGESAITSQPSVRPTIQSSGHHHCERFREARGSF